MKMDYTTRLSAALIHIHDDPDSAASDAHEMKLSMQDLGQSAETEGEKPDAICLKLVVVASSSCLSRSGFVT